MVGYGKDDNGKKYWIIKNWWGEEWRREVRGYGEVSQDFVNTSVGPMYLLDRL